LLAITIERAFDPPSYLFLYTTLNLCGPEAVRTLVGVAEDALEVIKERDRLAGLRSATGDVMFPIWGGLPDQAEMTYVVSASSESTFGRDGLPA